MTNVRNQLRPLSELSGDVAAMLDNYPQRDGYLLELFRVFANSQRFLNKGVANLLDKKSPLDLRERELVILRTCANRRCEYEWGVHVAEFATAAGFDESQINSTALGSADDPCWSFRESLLLRVVDELCEAGTVARVLAEFEVIWSLEQQLEILALCGNYHTISFVANTARLDREVFAPGFPD